MCKGGRERKAYGPLALNIIMYKWSLNNERLTKNSIDNEENHASPSEIQIGAEKV